MTELQISYFLEAAKCLNLTKVAARFYVSQPAVSKQIADLEKELGCQLFTRTKSRIILTDAGKLFEEFFENFNSKLIECKTLAQQFDSGNRKFIRVGILEGWNTRLFLSERVMSFRQNHPEVDFILESRGFKSLIYALSTNKLDIVVDPNKVELDSQAYDAKVIASLSRVLLYPNQPKYLDHPRNSLYDFKDENFIVISDDEVASSIQAVTSCCKAHGFEPKIHLAPNISSMIAGVQSGMGVAVADEWTGTTHTDLKYIRIDEEPHVVRLAWRKRCPEHVREFAEAFQKLEK